QLDLHFPVVSTQGAVIGDPQTGRVLMERTIPLPTAQKVARWVEENSQLAVFYFNDASGRTHLYQNRFADDPQDLAFHDHVFGAPRIHTPSFLPKVTGPGAHPPLKFILD